MSSADTSMYQSMIRPTPDQGPLDLATKAVALKTALGRQAMQPLEMEQTRLENEKLRNTAQTSAEDRADTQVLQQIYGDVQHDTSVPPDKKLDVIRERAAGKVKPRTLEALSKQIEDHNTALQKFKDDDLKNMETSMKEIGNTAAGILSAPKEAQTGLYATERARLIKSGIATEDHIPVDYDPNWLQMAATHAMGAQNAATAEMNRREDRRKQDESDRKSHTADLANAGQEVEALKSQDEYTAWRDKLPPKVKALTAATWTPANVATIQRLGLTAEQQQKADESAATEAETKRHNTATEDAKADSKTYTGRLRAALVAIGADDPDNPTKAEADAALKKMGPDATTKPVAKSVLVGIENDKGAALAKSTATLDKEISAATIGGKVLDQDAIDTAWDDHIERLRAAQRAYEHALTTATGEDVGHNPWADNLRAPGKGGAAPHSAATPASAARPAQAPGAAPAAGQPNPKAVALASKYHVNDEVTIRGKRVKITAIDPKTGEFDYDPVPAKK